MPTTSREVVRARLDEVIRLLERQRVVSSLASRVATPRRDLVEQLQHVRTWWSCSDIYAHCILPTSR